LEHAKQHRIVMGIGDARLRAGQQIAMDDAIRALDEQRKEVVSHSDASKLSRHDNATAPAMNPAGADPPWLGDMVSAMCRVPYNGNFIAYMADLARAVRKFEATQPPSEAEVQDAHQAYHSAHGCGAFGDHTADYKRMRLALIAAAKARSGG
jgi:hypothetical protein